MENSHESPWRFREIIPYVIAAFMIAYALILLILVASDVERAADLLRSLR